MATGKPSDRRAVFFTIVFAALAVLAVKLCDQISELPTKTKILERLIFEIITRHASPPKELAELAEGTLPSQASTRRKAKARPEKEQPASTVANVKTPQAA